VLGYDTFIRMIDLKYYENSVEKMKQIFSVFKEKEITFYVGGRYNINAKMFEILDNLVLDGIPEEFKYMFTAVKDFRADISSTELRQKGITTEHVASQGIIISDH
jgi:hypothetical protein